MHNGKLLLWDGWQDPSRPWSRPGDPDRSRRQRTGEHLLRTARTAARRPPPDRRRLRQPHHRQHGHRRHQHLRPRHQHVDPGRQHAPAALVPDLTELADGRYVAISGNTTDASTGPIRPRSTTRPPTRGRCYRRGHLPGARGGVPVLLPGAQRQGLHHRARPRTSRFFLDVNNQTWTPVGPSGIVNGSSVMYRPGKILYSGGAASVTRTTPARPATAVIDLTAATPDVAGRPRRWTTPASTTR